MESIVEEEEEESGYEDTIDQDSIKDEEEHVLEAQV